MIHGGTLFLCGVCHRVRLADEQPRGWTRHTTRGPSTAHLCEVCPVQRPHEVHDFLNSLARAAAEVP